MDSPIVSIDVYKEIYKNLKSGVVQFDDKLIVKEVNEYFSKMFNLNMENIIGIDLIELLKQINISRLDYFSVRKLIMDESIDLDGYNIDKYGNKVYLNVKGNTFKDSNGKMIGGYLIISDITQYKITNGEIQKLAYHDKLTGIYNRTFLEEEIKRYERIREYPISIIYMDLNNLKLINDTLGHTYGDLLLINASRVISKTLRPSDIFARIGGDEFLIFLPSTDKNACNAVIDRIRNAIELYNIEADKKDFLLSISIGSYTQDEYDGEIKNTIKKAEANMYRDKLLNSHLLKKQTLETLLITLGEKDFITKGHVERVKKICLDMARKLNLSDIEKHELSLFAEVHDIGKIAIPDNIIFKNTYLNNEEWELIKSHSEIGYNIALNNPSIACVAEYILKHHERFDGRGYPLGIKGKEIPLYCRILSIADAYDAMTSIRPYNKLKTKDEALKELKNCSGKQFDPDLVDLFIEIMEE